MRLRRSWLPVMALVLAGCALDGISSTDPEPEIGPGTVYGLIRVNGLNVPAQVQQGQSVVEVTKGALTLAADSTWILSVVLRASGGSQSQISIGTQRGRYRVSGLGLTMSVQSDTTIRYRGSYGANDISLTDISVPNGDQMAFRR